VHEHPSVASLKSFLLGELPVREVKLVVAHLARGCARCEDRVEDLSWRLFGDGSEDAGAIPAATAEAYDRAIDRALAAALAEHAAATAAEIAPSPPADPPADLLELRLLARTPDPAGPKPVKDGAGAGTTAGMTARRGRRPSAGAPLCEELIAKSRSFRHRDPKQMIHYAKLARFAAENLNPANYGRETVLDMQAWAAAELANAYRVADDPERAEALLREAVETSASGSGDPLLLARLMDLLASLYCHRRQFAEAIELLDAVYAIYSDLGDEHRAGRALISKGLYTGYANDPRQALVLLAEGFERIDLAREPELTLAAVHNILDCLVELGRGREARPLLERFRPFYEKNGGRLNLLKLRWVEGKVAAGCNELPEAERCLSEVRRGFEEAGLASPCAQVSLDLVAVWLHQGRIGEARDLVEQVIATFKALRIGREALAALLLLRDAFTHQGTALGMLRSVAECLKRLDSPPGASGLRFDPEGG
jgi:tetratricopeptide (TPR) repeat protein